MRKRRFHDGAEPGQSQVFVPGRETSHYDVEWALKAAKARADQLRLFRERSKAAFQNGR